MSYRIIEGDIRRFCEHYHGEPFHAVLCDAPYEMAFMGRDWDASGVSFDPETWRGISNLLHPGGFLFVFAGTVNDDLISVAMRKAGLRKHHKMLGWVTGSGFPKATRIDTQVDRDAGVKRDVVRRRVDGARNSDSDTVQFNTSRFTGGGSEYNETAPATPLAQTWVGHRYGGQLIKPAIETVLVFQKPYKGRPVDCITETGAGALWIDGSRIRGTKGNGIWGTSQVDCQNTFNASPENLEYRTEQNPAGRWPANFFLGHSPLCFPVGVQPIRNTSGSLSGSEPSKPAKNVYGEYDRHEFERYGGEDGMETVVEWDCVEECPVRRLGEQSGECPTGGGVVRKAGSFERPGGWKEVNRTEATWESSSGTAARYFFQSHWLYERLESSDPILYCTKASRKERDAGLDDLSLQTRNRVNPGGLENEPRWAPVKAKNTHPTVKPIALNKWLATLLLPPPDYAPRRLLVPFAGSGSEMIGAMLVGWEEIVGVELLQENVDIAVPRLIWWYGWSARGVDDVDYILKNGVREQNSERTKEAEQLRMFK